MVYTFHMNLYSIILASIRIWVHTLHILSFTAFIAAFLLAFLFVNRGTSLICCFYV